MDEKVDEFKFSLTKSVNNLLKKLDNWLDAIVTNIPNIILAVLLIVVFYFLSRFISRLVAKLLSRRVRDFSIISMTRRILKIVIILIGVFLALVVMKLDTVLAGVLTAAGIAGLAIGLALQATLSNVFSGLVISFLPKVHIGDWIESNDFAGKVTDISLRSVTITGADNNEVVIPNSKVVDNPIKNYSLTNRSRISLECGIGYESDLPFVKNLLEQEFAKEFTQGQNEEIEFYYQEFGDSSINFIVRYWVPCNNKKDELKYTSDGILLIKKLFDVHNVNIPFPIRTLEVRNNTPLQIKSD